MNEILQIVSLLLNAVLGGSLIVTVYTLNATRREANANARAAEANADSDEIKRTEGAVKIWREVANEMYVKQDELAKQVEDLSVEVRRLKNATTEPLWIGNP